MKVSTSETYGGVVDDATLGQRQELRILLETETKTVGNRMFFKPTRRALDVLAKEMKADFAPECRTAWGHFYKSRATLRESFEFKTTPYDHQRDKFEETKDLPAYGLFWEMGCGKTKPLLDTAAWLFHTGQIDGVLIVTLKGVHANWVTREIPAHLGIEKHKAAYWSTTKVEGGMRGICEFPGLAIAAINYDALANQKGNAFKFCQRFARERRLMVIVDESHGIKNPAAQRTRAVRLIGKLKGVKFKRIATGTSTTGSPLDLFAQMKFLDERIFPDSNSMGAFKHHYAKQAPIPGTVDPYNKGPNGEPQPIMVVTGYKNLDKLRAEIAPYCHFLSKDECLTLPPKVYRRHPFVLTPEVRKLYQSMKKDLMLELESGERVTAQLALTKLLRLHQLVCGFTVPDGAKIAVPIADKNPRLDAFSDYSEKVRGKAIVWATYQFNLDELEEHLLKTFGNDSVVTYRGSTSDSDRERAVTAFQGAGGPQWFLGQPQAGGTGITLTAARDVAYYSNNHNLALRLQSEDRAHRIGQTGTVTYTDFEALNTVERQIITALIEKRAIDSEISGKALGAWLTADE